jgi:hypothetical protein
MSFRVEARVFETDPKRHADELQRAARAAVRASRRAIPEPSDPGQWTREDKQLDEAMAAVIAKSGELPEGGRYFVIEGDQEKATHNVVNLDAAFLAKYAPARVTLPKPQSLQREEDRSTVPGAEPEAKAEP